MNEAKKYIAGNTMERFSEILKLIVGDANVGWEPIERTVDDWDKVFEDSKSEMLEHFYGKLAMCAYKKGYSLRKELKRLIRKYPTADRRAITPRFLAMMPETTKRTELLELTTDLYWLDNSIEASVDLAKLFAWSISGNKSVGPKAMMPLFEKYTKQIKREISAEDDPRKPFERAAIEDVDSFPFIQHFMLLAFSDRSAEEILTFPHAAQVVIPFARMMVGRSMTGSHHQNSGKEIIKTFLAGKDSDTILQLYADEFVRDCDLDENDNVELDLLFRRILFNQQFIETVMHPVTNWLAACGLTLDDIVAPGKNGLLKFLPHDLHDFVEWNTVHGMSLAMQKQCTFTFDENYNTQVRYLDPVREREGNDKKTDKKLVQAQIDAVQESLSVAFLPDYHEMTPINCGNCEELAEEEVIIDSTLPAQVFLSVLMTNMAAQIIELRTAAADPDRVAANTSVSEEKRKAREASAAQQKMIDQLRKENEALKKKLAETEKKHKEAAAAEIKRHKNNFNAAQEELTATKRQLRDTRTALEEEIMARIAAQEPEVVDEPAPEVEEAVSDEKLIAEIRAFTKKRKVVVIGGTAYWKNRLASMYPDIEFYNAASKKRDHPGRMMTMTGIDYLVANSFNTSHTLYNATTMMSREHGIPLYYMPYGQSVNRFNEVMRSIIAADKEETK